MDWVWRKLGYDESMKDVDPSLREFLKQQRPTSYQPSPKPEAPPEAYRQQMQLPEPVGQTAQIDGSNRRHDDSIDRPLPRESLFQDGRYKELWKHYRPQQEVDRAGMSDQERLNETLYAWKDRTETLGAAAKENCAMEQFDLHSCFRKGGVRARMTMCSAENKALDRCVLTQGKLLRALGYLTMYERSDEEQEKIQMHADKIYQSMLSEERQIQEAKDKGLPEPAFTQELGIRATDGHVVFDQLSPNEKKQMLDETFKGLAGRDLEIAIAKWEQERRWNFESKKRLADFYEQQRIERWEREEQGKMRFGDRVMQLLDFRDWSYLQKEREAEKLKTQSQHSKDRVEPS